LPTLEVEGLLCHGHGPFSLQLQQEECVALSGPSGVGKSLLLRSIADLEPHQGVVSWNGVNSRSLTGPQWRQRIGYLAAESEWWSARVDEHFPTPDARELLPLLDFYTDVWSARVADLSTGERQRLALLRLLAIQPQVLLLDEPTVSLDPDNSQRVEQLLEAHRHQYGTPVLWVSHDPKQIERVADRHLILGKGGLKLQELAA